MAKRVLSTTIKLRRDTINNYASYPNHIPLKGEICIVDPTASTPWTQSKNIRIKIGDGVTTWSNLKFYDEQNSSVLCGYYYNGGFYQDLSHTIEIEDLNFKTLYVDLHQGIIYYYDGVELKANVVTIPNASALQPGIMKLYQTLGSNTDGTMSQKAITDAISSIRLAVDPTDSEAFGLLTPSVDEN